MRYLYLLDKNTGCIWYILPTEIKLIKESADQKSCEIRTKDGDSIEVNTSLIDLVLIIKESKAHV